MAAILCNAPPLVLGPPLLIIIAQSLTIKEKLGYFFICPTPLPQGQNCFKQFPTPWVQRAGRVPGVAIEPCTGASSRVLSPRTYVKDCVTCNSCQLSPVRVGRHCKRVIAFILTAVKRKIYLEVLVEDHYLLPVRLINLFLFY